MVTEQEFATVLAMIAQGVINIDEGLTTIEKDSPVHQAMVKLCEMVNAGKVGVVEKPAKRVAGPKIKK